MSVSLMQAGNHSAAMSMSAYDARASQSGYPSSQDAGGYAQHPQSAASSFRSYAEPNGAAHRETGNHPQIYTVSQLSDPALLLDLF
jgi:hypothetical protein